ncbi:MAG: alginate lyase family protein, partial [Bacteroides sp.]|nr:alginate lyase family protein [Bacteroides sp.]
FLLCVFTTIHAQWLWDIEKMREIKKEIQSPAYAGTYTELIKESEKLLNKKPYSVTDKEYTPPSGDKHDYVSLSRYAWPDLEKPDGLPYKLRDGESNPELEKYDRIPLGSMAHAVNTLCLAYFYSENEKYTEKAMDFIRTWFIHEETKMNPNLNYSQFMPGTNNWKGRVAGLIDTYSFVELLNSIQLLHGSGSYTLTDKLKLREWFADFSTWWKTSEQGIQEYHSKNNHGLAYDVQLTIYLLFSGNVEDAKKVIEEFPQKRMFAHIEPDGKQPQELRRTLAFHYSEYNIRHMIDMFAIARGLGINLYNIESEDGRSFYKAVDFLTPYLGKTVEEWPYRQISGWDNTLQAFCEDLYRIVALDKTKVDYLNLYKNKAFDKALLLYGNMYN